MLHRVVDEYDLDHDSCASRSQPSCVAGLQRVWVDHSEDFGVTDITALAPRSQEKSSVNVLRTSGASLVSLGAGWPPHSAPPKPNA
jgi:hypothetical protein